VGPVTRRATLGGAAALAAVTVAGCTDDGSAGRTIAPAPTRRAGTDPDVLLAASVLADERELLERVKATTRRHPALKGDLAGARAAHRAHVKLLARAVPKETASPSPSASPSATESPTAPPRRAPVPAKPGPALAALARAEDGLSHRGRRSAFAARSGAFARVLASMAAAAAQQATELSSAAQDRA
jgi:hypothetical protein